MYSPTLLMILSGYGPQLFNEKHNKLTHTHSHHPHTMHPPTPTHIHTQTQKELSINLHTNRLLQCLQLGELLVQSALLHTRCHQASLMRFELMLLLQLPIPAHVGHSTYVRRYICLHTGNIPAMLYTECRIQGLGDATCL